MRNSKGTVTDWVLQEQGKHFCDCGCNEPIKIQRHHFYVGIPKKAYHLKKKRSKIFDILKWVEENQNKHICLCGCEQFITITNDHNWRGIPRFIDGHKGIHTKEAFWGKVEKTDCCWLWTGKINKWGYGRFQLPANGKVVQAHRYAYSITFGEIPEGLFVCHHCDCKNCCRPDHLFLGTHEDNMDDWAMKGLAGKKLEKEDIIEIMKERNSGRTITSLAIKYGVSRSTIKSILRGRIWSHFTGIPKVYK